MKRILVVLMFTVMSLNALALDLWVKGGVNQGTGSKKMEDFGYNAALELSQGFLGFVDLGAGIAYNGNLKFDGISVQENVGYDLTPVYVFAKFNIIPVALKPYVVARLGKNFVVNDNTDYNGKSEAKGGAYGAVGVGVEFLSSFQGEVLYSISEVRNNPSGKDNVDMVSLTLGYNFF
ncbi:MULTISPECIES: outer membrane beta-barrel protein [Psychrilyobacter]|uniref:Outer membrane protein beta-barrel domain-containing protein n=1 Tax=Psychrilyobacter piezotolerans TaxID=2293438 RepID=A0ABX9KDU2_9FUSO|nr:MULTISPECIES: outer membrane beta-barrel protein [Psychrilyobacter]MCS5422685.1 outer membrane beta-barrel protein [Psychrilyobacter sp. S5]NDI78980.1 outer membrane beta-barrel protein [Psychrilyobacter piezotolerans]RDE59201.1 hypothetical protein DV867_13490 [Psychrilyobacter sp. S5]REI39768.1 hypothetical protein DYH56_13490 [Psychrilyobacter piezotolerans]